MELDTSLPYLLLKGSRTGSVNALGVYLDGCTSTHVSLKSERDWMSSSSKKTDTIPYCASDYLDSVDVIVKYLILAASKEDPARLELAMYEVIEALMRNKVRISEP
jgi:hypothetical protein